MIFHLRFPTEHISPILSVITTAYANWRISPTNEEQRSYNTTKKILLTFDDFADEEKVSKILQILEREQIKAAFFLIGELADENPSIGKLIQKHGHWIGNHTKSHKNLLSLKEDDVRKEITGGPKSSLLRPPFGKYDQRVRNIAKDLGYKVCYWTIDSDDWKGISQEEIITRVIPHIHEGACILLHLNGAHTLEALPMLIQQIKAKGFHFCDNKEDLEV